ncbi:MAG: hypothetical protein D6766_14605 [Verrucomicrobia bacterium]|nr:MAG: hypothetical protein D6766_14605 [Verrucomicrobiota bacterium]
MSTADLGVPLNLLSSVTDSIHTEVELALAPVEAPAGTESAAAQIVTPPVSHITSSSVLNATVGQPLSYQITTDNQPTQFAATGLPEGLTLDPVTGRITGTPATAGVWNVTLEATGAEGTASGALTLAVYGGETVVFDNGNIWGVSSGPPLPTIFTITEATRITYVQDYHYFNGGVLPGTIGLQHEDGTVYGPWQANGRVGQGGVQNAYWEVWPMVVIKPGTYTVIDSHPPTWSYNSLSDNRGFTIIRGEPATFDTPDVLAAWAAAHGLDGAAGSAEADPDGDDQPNWVELARGSNPAVAEPPPRSTFAVENGRPTLRVPVAAGGKGVPGSTFTINGVQVEVQTTPSFSGGEWEAATAVLDWGQVTREDQGDGREVLVLPLQAIPHTEGARFFQIKFRWTVAP